MAEAPVWMSTGFELDPDIFERLTYGDWDPISISKGQIKWQLDYYKQGLEDAEKEYQKAGRRTGEDRKGAFSLASASIRSVISTLGSSPDISKEIETVARSMSSDLVEEIVRDPRTPYHVTRAFQSLPPKFCASNPSETAKAAVNIDEAILANERYIRNRGPERNKDGANLITLEHLDLIFGKNEHGGPRKILRKDPPKGGMEFYDAARPRSILIQPDTASFISTFDRITKDILKGLNWDNVFIAGGSILTTLLHVDPSKDNSPRVTEPDLDVYIYGLGPKEANAKMEHIFEIWSKNLPEHNKQKCVVKNAKTINFIADYPNRRIQIVLKLVSCPTSVLLNFDLDACAVGFNGKEVLMLPRFSRALETGYNVFTMDLIWGHHLGHRRASQEIRIFKYASRGFGIRILPLYINSLISGVDDAHRDLHSYDSPDLKRAPNGPEHPLKTLKRIHFLANDTVERFSFGPTVLTRKESWDDQTDEEFAEYIKEALKEKEAEKEERLTKIAAGRRSSVEPLQMAQLDGMKQHRSVPGARRLIACLEIMLRHHEAWRLNHEKLAVFDWSSLAHDVYDPESYSDLPKYSWSLSKPFYQKDFEEEMDKFNEDWESSARIHAQYSNGHESYTKAGETRWFLRYVYGPDLQTVMNKPIRMGLYIPEELEDFIVETITDAVKSNGIDEEEGKKILAPLSTPSGSQVSDDEDDSVGRVRAWTISNDLMWSNIDRRIDECFEVLWTLYHFESELPQVTFGDREAKTYFTTKYRRRIPPTLPVAGNQAARRGEEPEQQQGGSSSSPKDAAMPDAGKDEPTGLATLPDREKRLFAYWALRWPVLIQRHYVEPPASHYSEIDECNYPPKDDLFWKEGDEGDPKGHDNDWITVDEEEEAAERRHEQEKRALVVEGHGQKRKATASVSSVED